MEASELPEKIRSDGKNKPEAEKFAVTAQVVYTATT